jgi:SAM-dependent methyltransferase
MKMDLKEESVLDRDSTKHWYYQSKVNAMFYYLGDYSPQLVLDVGAGSGLFSREILRRTNAIEAICIDPGYTNVRDETVADKPMKIRRDFEDYNADLVLMMDVLEHVDDDMKLLCDYVSKVSSGTRFLITVPAFEFMWSEHDDFLEHKRRYALGQLESLVHAAGLDIDKCSYYFGLVFPLAFIDRMISNIIPASNKSPQSHLRQHSKVINYMLAGICKFELPLFRVNRVAGLSVFCLARKQ